MSYILDALKKADRERHWAKIPTLQTVHAISTGRRQRLWPWIGAIVVLVSAAASIWALRPGVTPSVERSADSTAVPAGSAPPAVSGPARPLPPAEHPTAASPAENPAVVAATPAEPTLPPGSASARRGPQPGPTPKATKRTEADHTSSVALAPAAPKVEASKPEPAHVSVPPASPAAPEKPAVLTPTRPVPTPPTAAVPEGSTPPAATGSTKPAQRGAASLPALQDMGPADREAMPKMTLQFLVYSEVPAERLVFINNQKYLEGQSIDGKVMVEAIKPDGALLSYQGKRFMLRQ